MPEVNEEGVLIERNVCTMHYKASHPLQERILNYAAKCTGGDISQAQRDLVQLGIDSWDLRQAQLKLSPTARMKLTPQEREKLKPTPEEKVLMRLWKAFRRERQRDMLKDLARVRDFDDKEFRDGCRSLGFIAEADEIRQEAIAERAAKTDPKHAARNSLAWLLKGILRAAGPAGIQSKQLFEIARSFDFSKQQIDRALHEINAIQFWQGRHRSMWKLPE